MVRSPISPEDAIVNFFLFPFAYAYAQPHFGLADSPYSDETGYGRGARTMAVELTSSAGGFSASPRAELRVRGENRLGWDAAFTRLSAVNFWSAHVSANYVQTPSSFLELGIGAGGTRGRAGLSAELAFETFPRRPWSFSARWAGTVVDGDVWNELSASAGLVWRRVGLGAGWRAFLGAPLESNGPEAVFRVWF